MARAVDSSQLLVKQIMEVLSQLASRTLSPLPASRLSARNARTSAPREKGLSANEFCLLMLGEHENDWYADCFKQCDSQTQQPNQEGRFRGARSKVDQRKG